MLCRLPKDKHEQHWHVEQPGITASSLPKPAIEVAHPQLPIPHTAFPELDTAAAWQAASVEGMVSEGTPLPRIARGPTAGSGRRSCKWHMHMFPARTAGHPEAPQLATETFLIQVHGQVQPHAWACTTPLSLVSCTCHSRCGKPSRRHCSRGVIPAGLDHAGPASGLRLSVLASGKRR